MGVTPKVGAIWTNMAFFQKNDNELEDVEMQSSFLPQSQSMKTKMGKLKIDIILSDLEDDLTRK